MDGWSRDLRSGQIRCRRFGLKPWFRRDPGWFFRLLLGGLFWGLPLSVKGIPQSEREDQGATAHPACHEGSRCRAERNLHETLHVSGWAERFRISRLSAWFHECAKARPNGAGHQTRMSASNEMPRVFFSNACHAGMAMRPSIHALRRRTLDQPTSALLRMPGSRRSAVGRVWRQSARLLHAEATQNSRSTHTCAFADAWLTPPFRRRAVPQGHTRPTMAHDGQL